MPREFTLDSATNHQRLLDIDPPCEGQAPASPRPRETPSTTNCHRFAFASRAGALELKLSRETVGSDTSEWKAAMAAEFSIRTTARRVMEARIMSGTRARKVSGERKKTMGKMGTRAGSRRETKTPARPRPSHKTTSLLYADNLGYAMLHHCPSPDTTSPITEPGPTFALRIRRRSHDPPQYTPGMIFQRTSFL